MTRFAEARGLSLAMPADADAILNLYIEELFFAGRSTNRARNPFQAAGRARRQSRAAVFNSLSLV
eukprot:9385147-Pyramimonas_sp.AAC.1